MSVPIGSAPLVGRARELALLGGQLATVEVDASAVVLVSGDAGIGKSRLAAEVQAEAGRRGFLALQGHCFETDRNLPYAPILDLLLRSASGDAPEEVATVLGPTVGALLAVVPEAATQFTGVPPAPPLDPEQARRRLCGAFARAVADLAARRPVLLVVEDLHWGDEASLELLLYLLRRLPSRSVLALLTYRSDDPNPALAHTLAELDRARIATEVALPALSVAEMDVMLRAIFRQEQPVRGEFLEAIRELTGGNPFFIEEVLSSLILDGDIFYADGRWDRL